MTTVTTYQDKNTANRSDRRKINLESHYRSSMKLPRTRRVLTEKMFNLFQHSIDNLFDSRYGKLFIFKIEPVFIPLINERQ
jgi:hypothetical protein